MIVVKLREAMERYRTRTGVRLTYDLLAERTGLSKATIESIGGRRGYNTTLLNIDKLCSVLECDVAELLEYQDD